MKFQKTAIAGVLSLGVAALVSGCGKTASAPEAVSTTPAAAPPAVAGAPAPGYKAADDTGADAQKYRQLQQSAGSKSPYVR